MNELSGEDREIAEQYIIKLEAHRNLIEIMKVTMEAMVRTEAGVKVLEEKLAEKNINIRDIEIDTDES